MVALLVRSIDSAAHAPAIAPIKVKGACPGLYYTTAAQDGLLVRVRVPGGYLTSSQCRLLATISQQLGDGAVQVTNRANLQIRGLQAEVPNEILLQLQAIGLAAPCPEVDHLRNVMASPTAGIDPAQLLDTRSIVQAIDHYLSTQPELAGLSPKFSIGVDGGEQAAILHQPNDLIFRAVARNDAVRLALNLAGFAVPGLIQPDECVAWVAAIAHVYLDITIDDSHAGNGSPTAEEPAIAPKPRLKQTVAAIGSEAFLDRVQSWLQAHWHLQQAEQIPTPGSEPGPVSNAKPLTHSLGTHPQRQPGYSYIGVALPLGQVAATTVRQLADLAERYGSGTLRITPWRSMLLPDLPNGVIAEIERSLDGLGLARRATTAWSQLIACSGSTGCAESATDTQADAAAIAQFLDHHLPLDRPITIHVTGCPKSCAAHGSSDITLLGTQVRCAGKLIGAYHLYVGNCVSDAATPLGRHIAQIPTHEVPQRLLHLIQRYQQHRSTPDQPFQAFMQQRSLAQLQRWVAPSGGE